MKLDPDLLKATLVSGRMWALSTYGEQNVRKIQFDENQTVTIMVLSDLIAVHQLMSADATLSQQLLELRIFVCTTRIATQKTSVGRR